MDEGKGEGDPRRGGGGVERTMRPASSCADTTPHQYNSLTAVSKQNMGS